MPRLGSLTPLAVLLPKQRSSSSVALIEVVFGSVALAISVAIFGLVTLALWVTISPLAEAIAAGFFVGVSFAGMFFAGHQQWVIFLIAVVTGLIGALLAVFAQRVAFALAGFFAGAYIMYLLTNLYGLYEMSVFLSLAGGVTGAVMVIIFIDWAVIALSSLVGAGIIIDALNPGQAMGLLIFTLLVSAGVFFQSRLKKS